MATCEWFPPLACSFHSVADKVEAMMNTKKSDQEWAAAAVRALVQRALMALAAQFVAAAKERK
jgi:hypothetical protein